MRATCRAVHTRFPFGSTPEALNLAPHINSPDRSTKSTTSSVNALCVLVNTRFQVLFHSPSGVLFTFPSQYCSTIGHQVVFRLGGGPPVFRADSTCPRVLWIPLSSVVISITGLSPSSVALPIAFFYDFRPTLRSEPRRYYYLRFGLFRFRSPLLAKSRLISFPPPT